MTFRKFLEPGEGTQPKNEGDDAERKPRYDTGCPRQNQSEKGRGESDGEH
jgi:hypothetical protein